MLRYAIISVSILLFIYSGYAQRTYSINNLQQLSASDLDLYHQKSMNLQRNGEIMAITGGVVGLAGILAGTLISDNSSSNVSLNALTFTSAAIITGGTVATIVGFSLYVTGASRVSRINKIQNTEVLRLEIMPDTFYCGHIQSCQTGIKLRISF